MKKLSIEEKAKAYDEAIKQIEECTPDENGFITIYPQEIFPELKESEDDRIRKELIEFVKSSGGFKQEYIAWLEKQGEHANFRNKIQIGDKVTRNEDGVLVNLSQLNRVAKKDKKQGEQNPALSKKGAKGNDKEIPNSEPPLTIKHAREVMGIKQDTAWSEEDEVKINRIVACLENLNVADNDILLKNVAWLKSLKDRYTWKPSDEQMKALGNCIGKTWFDKDMLKTLYNDLQNL